MFSYKYQIILIWQAHEWRCLGQNYSRRVKKVKLNQNWTIVYLFLYFKQIVLLYYPGHEMDAGRIGLCIVLAGMMGSVCCGIVLDKTHRFKWVRLHFVLIRTQFNVVLNSNVWMTLMGWKWWKTFTFFPQRDYTSGVRIFDDWHVDLHVHIECRPYSGRLCDIIITWVSVKWIFLCF